MPCLAAPRLPPPPGLSLLLPTLVIPSPSVGITFCCKLTTPNVPGFPLVIPLGLLIPAGGAVAMAAVVAVINEAVDQVNALLDQLSFECPLD
jgi:hypothetical protein